MPKNDINSVKPFKSKNCDKIYLDAPNPNLKKRCDRDFRAINYYVDLLDEKFKRARKKFIVKILFELYETFHPIKPHNSLSLENLYHNLFSDLDLEHPDRFDRDFFI